MVDDKDLAILRELLEDSRRSTNRLSEKPNIPRATIHERIKKAYQRG